jgi:PAN domain
VIVTVVNNFAKGSGIMLRLFVAICALCVTSVAAHSEEFTFRVQNAYKFTARIQYFSQTRNAVWPEGEPWDLLDDDIHHHTLICNRGETICLEAYDKGNPGSMKWSTKTIARCDNCCWTCANAHTPVIVLSTLSAHNKRRPVISVDQSSQEDVGVQGKDMLGADWKMVSANSAQACHNSCGGEPVCKAWTWKRSTQQCFLKQGVPNIVSDADCVSGPIDEFTKGQMRKEYDTDRFGADIRHIPAANASACASACASDRLCHSWSFVSATKEGEGGACHLKDQVAQASLKKGVISGVNYQRENQ